MTSASDQFNSATTPQQESDAELFKRWDLPDVTQVPEQERGNAFNLRLEPESDPETTVEDIIEETPEITAEALEAIRQAAYEEGFELGQQEGQQQGYQAGLEQGVEAGTAQGVETGLQQGLSQGETEVTERAERLEKLMNALYHPQQQIDNQVEQQLIELTTQLAQAVVHHEIATNPTILLQSLKQAITLLPFQQKNIRIQLHPNDVSLIEQSYSAEQIEQRGWQLEAEPTLNEGDLQIFTEKSDINITMQERMTQVNQLFLAQLNHFIKPESSAPATAVASDTDQSTTTPTEPV